MTNPSPHAPDLDDVRDVLGLVLMLLSDSRGMDTVLDLLRAGAGDRNDELSVDAPAPAWAAANRFVLEILIEAQTSDLPTTDNPSS